MKADVEKIDEFRFEKIHKIEKYQLKNGLKIITFEDHSAPVFAYHTWFNVGSRNEREGITGIAHLFEHLMFKETKNMKEGEFDRIMEENGGSINAATYFDWTFYRESMPSETFDLIPKLEADRMQNMILNDQQVNSEREVVANERRFRVDNNPTGQMYEELYRTAYTSHPYSWPVIGWMKDIEAISLSDCLEFYSTYYAPNNATICVVGDVDTQNVLHRIQEEYGDIPASKLKPIDIPKEPKQSTERRKELTQAIPAEKLMVAFHIPDAAHPDYAALEMFNALLVNGRSSLLHRRLVTEGQLATSVMGWVNQLKDPGLIVFMVSMRPGKKSEDAEKILYETLTMISHGEMRNEDFVRAKNRLETSFWKNFFTADQKAQGLGFYETVRNDYRYLFQEIEDYTSVPPVRVKEVARKYFDPSNRTVITSRPQKRES